MRRLVLMSLVTLAACEGEFSGGELPSPPMTPRLTGGGAPGGAMTAGGTAAAGGEAGGTVTACTSTPSVGANTVRRLTRWEYDNTVRDLVGVTTNPSAEFSAEEEALGFTNNSASLTTTPSLVEKQLAAAEAIATTVSGRLSSLRWYTCNPASETENVCAVRFIDSFGQRAYRRPLTEPERAALFTLFQQGRAAGGVDATGQAASGFLAGIQLVITGALLSPDFLYRMEASGTPGPVTDLELASRLSFLLWGSMPDDTLLTAAVTLQLHTPEQLATQAERMLRDDKARAVVKEFHKQWLDFDRVHNAGKARSVFPEWSATIADLMEAETGDFIVRTVFDGEGTWDALMTSSSSYLTSPLAQFYGVPFPSGSGVQRVTFDARRRAGLLTQGSLLSINAHSDQTSPVHRGMLVRQTFLCEVLPAPPANVSIEVPAPTPGSTARERFAQHSSDAACTGCHQLMDPLGFGFENYDGVGRWRDLESGKPIDSSGMLFGTDAHGPYQGPVELAQKLASSTQARGCYVKQWFRFAYGRGEVAADACTMERLNAGFQSSGRDVKALLTSLTQTDAFRTRAGDAP
ncbi:MAG: DUF1592 domain-containing protein [Myxococcales bacterium]|nr:DUF1592 domain-containing protein [Myxococcales bacterium]